MDLQEQLVVLGRNVQHLRNSFHLYLVTWIDFLQWVDMPIKKPRRKHSIEGLVELLKAANGGTLPSGNLLREFRGKGAEKESFWWKVACVSETALSDSAIKKERKALYTFYKREEETIQKII